jgi:hypothetical protein
MTEDELILLLSREADEEESETVVKVRPAKALKDAVFSPK